MFSFPEATNVTIIDGEYVQWMVILSILIACCASYTAISMNQRMQQSSFFHKSFWLLLASFAMGLGIWSMHFIGMSAFMLPTAMEYDLLLTVLSVLPAIFASYLAFYFANRTYQTSSLLIIAGIIMGVGIASMHYLGMAAMQMEVQFYYRPWIFAGSIGIAITVSYAALFTFSKLQRYMGNRLIKIIISILIGLAVSSMHYTGMSAVVFYTDEPAGLPGHMHEMDMMPGIVFISLGIFLLLLLSGLTSLLDRYVDHRINYFDSLTLLPNQQQFEKDIQHFSVGSLAIFHIASLEKYHSAYGYEFSARMIKTIGGTLRSLKPESAKIYRIEEGRFAILDWKDQHYDSTKASLQGMLTTLSNPLNVSDHQVMIEMAGAVSFTQEKKAGKEMFSNVMAVLHHPSLSYNHKLFEYDPEVHTFSFEKQLQHDISSAMENGELFLVYQPKVCSKTFQVTGAEALLRWDHASHGMISPGVFIPILEQSEKIYEVTDWVIEEACSQISIWLQEGKQAKTVSINIPGAYITSSRLLKVIRENLEYYDVSSDLLELEITETSVIHDIENAISAVKEFRNLGLFVALDDFGTGLSSLSYLRRLPVSAIKIDKSFVDGILPCEKEASLLSAIITLCYSLELPVVIEGVETREQIDFIRSMAEDPQIQGYYFSPPLRAEEFSSWVKGSVSLAE